MKVIYPPKVLGILGGGQLGSMFTLAAKAMGYQVIVLEPDTHSPAARFADFVVVRSSCSRFVKFGKIPHILQQPARFAELAVRFFSCLGKRLTFLRKRFCYCKCNAVRVSAKQQPNQSIKMDAVKNGRLV